MQPQLLQLPPSTDQSFMIAEYHYDKFPGIWHYHPEIELTYIQKGSGTRFVGDHIESFSAGDLIMIGANVPHTWKSDNDADESHALVLHFNEDCLGENFWNLPETASIKKLIEKSQVGLKINTPENQPIADAMKLLLLKTSTEKLIGFLDILSSVSKCKSLTPLSSDGFMLTLSNDNSDRINKAYDYVINNFTNELSLEAAAKLVNMSPSAFSRYFKAHTRKTFSDFIIEFRIRYACKLLMQKEQTVTQVCFESGFNNLSNFNKQFLKMMRITPKRYQVSMKNHSPAK